MATKLPKLHSITGIRIGTAGAGIKQQNRDDLALFELPPRCTCAAVFTRNAFCAAPVVVARQHLVTTTPRFFLINSGNANAGMGERSLRDAKSCCEAVAQLSGCADSEVLPFSTGVIGAPLPAPKIRVAIPTALAVLNDQGWDKAALAIMTTDTVPKAISKHSID
jgi:glutamate N-acetyltransferase/amino-acid N-acetyltransferase